MSVEATGWIDFVLFARDVNTNEKVSIVILDSNGDVAVDVNSDSAREVAERLVALADEMDREKARTRLRRLPDVDEELRRLDG
jgi:3-methyladenine DNA glycosylase/8-oxoguanine DNA glycosylase